MKSYLLAIPLLILPLSAQAGGPVERACLASERASVSASLCGCVQKAAETSLTRKDQRRAASFFRDPHKAQEVRQSDDARLEAFWGRYRGFVQKAERICS